MGVGGIRQNELEEGMGVHLVHDLAAPLGLELGAPVASGVHGFVVGSAACLDWSIGWICSW